MSLFKTPSSAIQDKLRANRVRGLFIRLVAALAYLAIMAATLYALWLYMTRTGRGLALYFAPPSRSFSNADFPTLLADPAVWLVLALGVWLLIGAWWLVWLARLAYGAPFVIADHDAGSIRFYGNPGAGEAVAAVRQGLALRPGYELYTDMDTRQLFGCAIILLPEGKAEWYGCEPVDLRTWAGRWRKA